MNEEKQNNHIKIEINKKDDFLRKIISTQNFVEGYWDINDITETIKKKYKKEFNALKGLKNKNIDDKIAITILIVYYINKECPEFLKELVMILKKAKIFIRNHSNDTYENITKEIGIN